MLSLFFRILVFCCLLSNFLEFDLKSALLKFELNIFFAMAYFIKNTIRD